MRLSLVAAIVVLAAFAAMAVAQPAPAPAPGPTAPGPGMRGGGQGMNMEQMFDQFAERIGLTEGEKTASKAAIREKMEATQALGQQLRALAQVARQPNASEAEMKAALEKYDGAKVAYEKRVKQIDTELGKKLSVKAKVALTALGVLDNGMGARFGGGMGPGGGMGGRGMRMRGGAGGGGGVGAPGAPAPQ